LRWRPRGPRHISRDGRLGDLKTEHQEFTMDPGCAPQWVLTADTLDEIPQATIDPRAPGTVS
jgi:hypothetical protein